MKKENIKTETIPEIENPFSDLTDIDTDQLIEVMKSFYPSFKTQTDIPAQAIPKILSLKSFFNYLKTHYQSDSVSYDEFMNEYFELLISKSRSGRNEFFNSLKAMFSNSQTQEKKRGLFGRRL